jgi:hypothetical protein
LIIVCVCFCVCVFVRVRVRVLVLVHVMVRVYLAVNTREQTKSLDDRKKTVCEIITTVN